MDTPDREQPTSFSQPIRQIVSMLIVLGLVGFGVRLVAPKVAPVFLANPYLNGFIGFVFLVGVLSCFWQVYQVAGSVRWLTGFVSGEAGRREDHAPRLLAPLATLLRSGNGIRRIGSGSARSILDSVATRVDEARDITRYIVNLLIFLGLLGTFYGLATTVPALVETIRSLAPRAGEEGLDVFNRLMNGLEGQLAGMGVAFASSLLGLAGSLVVGLLELFAGHGQNRFYRELEEWLSTITRLGYAGMDSDGGSDTSLGPAMQHLLEQLDVLHAQQGQATEAHLMLDGRIAQLADAMEKLAGGIEARPAADPALGRIAEGQDRLIALLKDGLRAPELSRLAEGQQQMVDAQDRVAAMIQRSVGAEHLARIAEGQARVVALMEEGGGGGFDAESRMHLRGIETQLLRILEEMASGRQEAVDDLRSEIAALSRAVRHLTTGGRRAEPPTPIVGRRG